MERLPRYRRPTTAWALAGLVLALSLVLIPLALITEQNPLVNAGPEIAVAVPFAAVGLVVARHRPTRHAGHDTPIIVS